MASAVYAAPRGISSGLLQIHGAGWATLPADLLHQSESKPSQPDLLMERSQKGLEIHQRTNGPDGWLRTPRLFEERYSSIQRIPGSDEGCSYAGCLDRYSTA